MNEMNVLIVDDSELNLAIYRNALKAIPECTSNCFNVSADALAWCETNEPDLLLVDYNMPAPNGLEFIERFRAMKHSAVVPVVMITGRTEREIRYNALERGANDFLTKPIDPLEFVARTRNLLALRDGRKKLADHAEWLSAEVRRATADIVAREKETISRLMRAAESRDNETGMHIVRMGHFCSLIAKELGFDPDYQELILMAAPMHDIGKVSTPDAILQKPGKLDAAEWEIMKQHAAAGYEILKDSQSELLQMGAEIALSHHEKFDGSGYPQALAGEAIPVTGRICAVSDVFDALTSVRPYKAEWPIEKAVALIEEGSGSHFDPEMVSAFLAALPQITKIKHEFADVA